MLKLILGTDKPLIGMVHLLPLPGSARFSGSLDAVIEQALADAKALIEGGMDGLLIENFGDLPFARTVEPHTVAAMSIVVREVAEAINKPFGVNVLRNDAFAALSIAHVTGAKFIRVNVWTGAVVTDQGIIEGCAHEVIAYRQRLGAQVKILADVWVKHGAPLGGGSIEQAAHDAFHRGLADAIIITGEATGKLPDLQQLRQVKDAVPEAPLFVGSGVSEQNIAAVLRVADGVIVGTALKKDGIVTNPVEKERVRRLVEAARRG